MRLSASLASVERVTAGGGAALSADTIGLIAQLERSSPAGAGRAEQIERQVENAIRIGLLSPGDRLPSEQVLAEQFGVAPLTLRQSLAGLRTRGLITTRRGRGGGSLISGRPALSGIDVERNLAALGSDAIRDLLDHVAAIGTGAVRLAVERADAGDLARLGALLARFDEASSADDARRAEGRLQTGLGVAAQSPRLTAAMVNAQSELATVSWGTWWRSAVPGVSAHHRRLLEAIGAGDPVEAMEIARRGYDARAERLLAERFRLLASRKEPQP